MAKENVPGKKTDHQVMLYALSTCGWCKKTRELLEEMGQEYDYEYVDLLEGEERDKCIELVQSYNPKLNFPTMVVDDDNCIVGYDENKIKEALA